VHAEAEASTANDTEEEPMPDARINGIRIWYKETGEGDPVVQIHGAGFGHFNFATATPVLSRTFRCIDFDMRGYGQSERPLQRYNMEVWADDIAGLMDHLGLQSAHIHGTSMGGMVAQQFAAKYPQRTQRLVINCSAAKLDYAGVLTFRGWIEIAERFGVGSRTLAELIALQALSRRFLDSAKGPEAVNMIQNILRDSNRVDIFKLACQAMIDMDLRPLLPMITAPTLIIGGDEDMMTPWQQAESGAGQDYLVQHIKGARKHVIKGSSHSTLFDGTEENCRVVAAFFNGEF
jgi:3-oxoadipate enol-lactonase